MYVVSGSAHLCTVSAKPGGEQGFVVETAVLAPCSCYSQGRRLCEVLEY